MLVISRKVGEAVLISDDIKVVVVSVSGDKVTFGIEAPRTVKVVREELLETIEANKAATQKVEPTLYEGMAAFLKQRDDKKKY